MRTVQLILLALFALCGLLSFVMRLRMGAINGAISRGEKPEDMQTAVQFYYRLACGFAIAAAVLLVVCIVVGALYNR